MASKIFTVEQYAQEHLRSCQLAWEEGLYSDVTLCIDKKKIPAHKLVLSGLSDYFKTLFRMDGKRSSEINLKEVNFEASQSLIKFAYTGSVEINLNNVEELLRAADYFQVTRVKTACIEFLFEHLSPESIVNCIILADKFNVEELYAHCLRFLGEEFEKISMTDRFLELPKEALLQILRSDKLVLLRNKMPILGEEMELSLFRGVLRYISHAKVDSKNVTELLHSIRLLLINKKKIIAELKKWPNLKRNKHTQAIFEMIEKPTKSQIPEIWTKPRKFLPIQIKKDIAQCANGGQLLRRDGGHYLSAFDDSVTDIDIHIVQITLWIRRWDKRPVLGGFAIKYANDVTVQHGEGANGGSHVKKHVIDLAEGECITHIRGRHGWVVDQLCFCTNNGKEYGPFGGDGGNPFICKPDGLGEYVCLHAFSGEIVQTQGYQALINLGFIWKYYDRNTALMSTKDRQKGHDGPETSHDGPETLT